MQTHLRRTRFATLFALAALPLSAAAATSGPSSTVVYVSGNDLVLKASDGKVLNYMVADGTKFTAGAKQLTLAELKPGTKLTATVSAGADPQVVAGIAVLKAKVYGTAPPDGITLTTPDGAKDFVVPAGTMFTVGGKPVGLAALPNDTMIDATVITPAAEGAESGPPPATPPMSGVLLIANTGGLPLAGTRLPFYSVSGIVLLLLGMALLVRRKPQKA